MSSLGKARFVLVFIFLIVLYVLIIVRLFYWQIIRGEDLKNLGMKQSNESLTVPAKRGNIFFSDGYPLATNKSSYLLYANPKIIEKPEIQAKSLSNILNIDIATISALFAKDLYWVRVANSLDVSQKLEVEKKNIQGLGFQENNLRYYPEASMAAHLIGFLGKDKDGNDQGYFGLEGFYNDQLSGRAGRLYLIHDALGRPILNDIREEKKIDGRSFVLNIDRTAQYMVEKKLKDGIEKYQAKGGSVIVMEPNSGRILAMASFPKFDPQKYYEYDYDSYKNPVITSLYEPGSTFKVLIMAAAVDLGLVKADTKCNICSSPVQIGEYKIKTWNEKYYPNTTMTEVIQHSDNTGMVFTARKLGLDNMIKYFKLFGLDEETDIDLQGEISAGIRERNQWYPIDLATASFGQGISLTPIQLLTAVSSIANGGNIVRPYVVSKITTEDGRKIEIKPEVKRRAISETSAKIVTAMMVNAIENGESKWVKIKGYKVAGKTGTAQIPIAGHYDPNETIASFVGFFPADKPKISMLVSVNRPKTSTFGSETAAPIFFSIARELINYYNIPPSY